VVSAGRSAAAWHWCERVFSCKFQVKTFRTARANRIFAGKALGNESVTDTIRLEPNPSNQCFGCGGGNAGGMKLTFEQDNVNRRIVGRFVLSERYQGGAGFAHGGIIALLLDEAMGKVCRFREVRAVTAEMTVEYLKPVSVEKEIIVEGRESEQNGRNLFMTGEIRNEAGEVLARGKGRFVVISQR
jgi:uncharacterized protein (TIGR00369 family)